MNFLEGLKRLFIVVAVFVVVGAGDFGWSAIDQPSDCIYLDDVKWDAPSGQPSKPLSPENIVAALDKFVPVEVCIKPMEYWPKKIGYTLGAVALAAIVLWLVWLTLRWIILGFWPGAARKP